MFPWLGTPCHFLSFLIICTRPTPSFAAACEPERCGNVGVSVPFGVVSGSDEKRCAQIGFQVTCTDGMPYLGYYQSKYWLQNLDIFYNNSSLLVSDLHKFGDFNVPKEKGCHVPKANTTTKIGHQFSISSLNQNLVFYNCTRAPAARAGLVDTMCRNNTFVRAGGRYNARGVIAGSYALPGCNVTTVSVLGVTEKVNASNYLELISDGFLLMWQPPSVDNGKLTYPRQSSNTSSV
ncbi:LEAF RUST 10 DISEASE-RESISTANCE LOCUS RECEPTOR-LIKE PROTEIN KINASE-like 1.2 [Hordeum vulgare subsp. vulgare]|uniref:LEAF RUST 10 DISEASE-RESISTANCE LOCUS RECEPTOR-LIKE PROTEIN KINASE-like 1.2 n=1 Tax=Hordeum vulgare subsp. vulgare TaxID=112509 RepID=UPI001D1A3427|nr:LEAF RUST 10 DISEASE-RESISTANCE LOCUS RECEPTOR-LIKE PROTEIN KINASE-like 1.2 [Hordeum vulgare subsp. vulgare]